MLRKTILIGATLAVVIPLLLLAQQQEKIDLNAIHKLKTAEFLSLIHI